MFTSQSPKNNFRFFTVHCRSHTSLSPIDSFKVINFSYWINCQSLMHWHSIKVKTKSVGHVIEIKPYFRGLCASAFQKPFLWCTITHYKSTVITDNLLLGNFHFKELVLIFHLLLIPPRYPSQKKLKDVYFETKDKVTQFYFE